MKITDREVNVTIALVKKAIDPSIEIDNQILYKVDWAKVLDFTITQGVSGLCSEAVNKSLNVPRNVLIKWICNVSQIERNYQCQLKVLQNLTNCLAENNVKFVVLKGLPLSLYYPVPNHRPFGDIDIYTFGDYDKVNNLMEKNGLNINYEEEKHSVFCFQGIMVENHSTLFDVSHSSIEKYTESLLAINVSNCVLTDSSYYIPNVFCNYIFLIRHLAKHFGDNEGVILRQIVDFALFLNANEKFIDAKQIQNVLVSTKLIMINDIMVSIAQDVTGFNLNKFIFNEFDIKNKKRVLQDILHTYRTESKKLGVCRKIQILLEQRWKYNILPESFYTRLKRAWRNF